MFSHTAPTTATIGSLNNELGVPLTMLRADAATRFLVLVKASRRARLGEGRRRCPAVLWTAQSVQRLVDG
ncbi:hypothetical protein GCM10010245_14390 [Streptomyces spectabilis]|uniref:Uncharacterized protein n=1 Tax=Streptomyces spectabilis TaxID=68270 RepID=A0A7W8AUW7_STRST|nr:hypothetical protein [Streptomyces spectabilis]GGV07064.1 hypothetical protein GCM10010245_14390 [Streptomyces spectabilis]